jgi:hypothetical protein
MPDYILAAERAAKKYGVDPAIFKAMIRQESGFRPNARSPSNAQGIAQFIPSTAAAYGVNLHDNRVTDDLEGAARYLRDNLRKTGGNYHEALSIYNSGHPDAYKDPSFAKGQTYNYVRTILANAGNHEPTGRASTSSRSASSSPRSTTRTVTTSPGVDNSDARRQALSSFLLGQQTDPTTGQQTGGDILSLALQMRQLKDVPAQTATVRSRSAAPRGSSGASRASFSTPAAKSGVANFEGKKVAAWIAPALAYARAHGWKGTVNSGFRSFADQTRIYNSGVRPAAKPGTSNHEGTTFPRGAVDVSDAAQLSAILKRSPYAGRLVWAGAKDPVHFSHPHNGSY